MRIATRMLRTYREGRGGQGCAPIDCVMRFAEHVSLRVAMLVCAPVLAAQAPAPSFCPVPARISLPDSLPDLRPPLVPTPKVVRGVYVNRWAALGDRGWQLIGLASRTEVNAR
jgi:hypothetical protein